MDLVTIQEFIDEMIAKYPDLLTDEIKGKSLRHDIRRIFIPSDLFVL